MRYYKDIRLIILIGLVVLAGILFLPGLPVRAAANDILVYYTDLSTCTTLTQFPPEIFITDLNALGYNVIVKYRAGADELGTTTTATINLLDYGQVWIIDTCVGTDFTASEITAVETFRNNGGGLLLSADNAGCQEIVNPITAIFNNGTNIFFGNQNTGSWCASSTFTWGGHSTVHPLYSGLTKLSSTDSDAQLNIQNSNIEVTAKNGANDYGAVLDEAGKGRIVFDTSSIARFLSLESPSRSDCSDAQESQYQQNIAQWLGGAVPPSCTWYNDGCGRGSCPSTKMHQTCSGPPGCSEGCTPGETRCVPDPTCITAEPCGDCVTTFSDGSASKMVTLPVGGGSAEFGKIKLPMGANVCSAKFTLDRTVGPGVVIGTPYIWVPLSGSDRLVQIKTDDGSFVAMYGKEGGGITCSAGTYCIWDCTANCNTNSPTWTERGEDADCEFNDNPSRITVFPGGDVWVANRYGTSVTRLGLISGCTGDNCYECKGTYPVGSGPRGVTFDNQGNIWVGDYGDTKIWKFNPDGTYAWPSPHYANIGYSTYGMIGDAYGYVWISTGGGSDVIAIDTANCTTTSCTIAYSKLNFSTGSMIYGIGINNEGDIWVGDWQGNRIHEIDGADGGSFDGLVKTCSSGLSGCCTGIAVDSNNNVWFNAHDGNTTYMIEGEDCSKLHSFANVCNNPPTTTGRSEPHGVAIDKDNNAWVVCRTGVVRKLKFDGNNIVSEKYIDLSSAVGSGTGDRASYNYSDMTGFRTVALNLTVGDYSIPISHFPQEISGTSLTDSLSNMLTNCSCSGCTTTEENICGNPICEIPTSLSSVFAGGNYNLSDFQICYTPGPSKIKGGLVPCGRKCDDPDTAIDESAPCTVCHFFVLGKRVIDFIFKFVVSPLLLLMIVISGAKFVGSAGNPEKIEDAKRILLAAVIGFLVVLLTWLTINVFLSFLVKGRLVGPSDVVELLGQPWDRIECPVKTNP